MSAHPDPADETHEGRLAALLSLQVDRRTAEVVTALDRAEIPSLLLKGPTIARWLYLDGAPRPYGDTDLLVPPSHFNLAQDVLASLGYRSVEQGWRPSEQTPHATTFLRPTGPAHTAAVDLHRSLAMVSVPADTVWQELSRDAQETLVGGATVRHPSAAGRCLVLALHAIQHGRDERKPWEDLRRGLAAESAETWRSARVIAERLAMAEGFDLALSMITEEDVTRTAAWRRSSPEVKLRAKGASRGAQSLQRMVALPWWRRPAFVLSRLMASRALLGAVDPEAKNAAYGHLLLRRLLAFVKALPAAVRDVRRLNDENRTRRRRRTE